MRRSRAALLAAACAPALSCVSVAPPSIHADPLAPETRLIVAVHPAPGPWIVADPDSKAESAAKILPVGLLVQTMQEDRIEELSKELEPYLPRPRLGRALERALLDELRALHGGPSLSPSEAGMDPAALRELNASRGTRDWRRRYLAPKPGRAPRDYSRFLPLDGAAIVEVSLSFGTDVDEEGALKPALSAQARVLRAETGRLLHSVEVVALDRESSRTLAEFRAAPKELTDRLEALVPALASKLALALSRGLSLAPPSPPQSPAEEESAPGQDPSAEAPSSPEAPAGTQGRAEEPPAEAAAAPQPPGSGAPSPDLPPPPEAPAPSTAPAAAGSGAAP